MKKANVNIVIIIWTSDDKQKTNRSCVSCSLINKRLKCYTYKLLIAFSTLSDIIIHSLKKKKINYVHQPEKLIVNYIYIKSDITYILDAMLQRVMSLNFQEAVQIVPTSNTIFFFITSGPVKIL